MSLSKNVVNVLGYVGKPLQSREHNGVTYVTFSVATNEMWITKEGDNVEHTEWHQIKMSGALAKLALQLLDKGSRVDITGKLRTEEYEDKDGIKRWTTYIKAVEFIALDKKADNDSEAPSENSTSDEELNIPF